MKENIIFLSSHYSSFFNFRKELIKSLNLKFNVILVSDFSNMMVDELVGIKKIDIKFKKYNFNILFDFFLIFKIFDILKKSKAKYVFSYNYKPVVYSSLLSFLFINTKFLPLISGLGFPFADSGAKRFLLKVISIISYVISFQNVTKIFVQNSDDYNFFKKLPIINIKKKLVNLKSSGININKYSLTDSPNKISFLFASRLLKDKGLIEFINAAKKINNKYNDIFFYIAGRFDKSSPSSIAPKIFYNLISNDIKYLGDIKKVKSLSKYCSVLVLPTYREGCPNIALELGLMGKPIIISKVPGCKNIILNSQSGFFINKKDYNDLFYKMEQFILNPNIINSFGALSRKHIINNHSLNVVNDLILNEFV